MTFVPAQWLGNVLQGMCPCPLWTSSPSTTAAGHNRGVEKWILGNRHNEEVDLAPGMAYTFTITVTTAERVSWSFVSLGGDIGFSITFQPFASFEETAAIMSKSRSTPALDKVLSTPSSAPSSSSSTRPGLVHSLSNLEVLQHFEGLTSAATTTTTTSTTSPSQRLSQSARYDRPLFFDPAESDEDEAEGPLASSHGRVFNNRKGGLSLDISVRHSSTSSIGSTASSVSSSSARLRPASASHAPAATAPLPTDRSYYRSISDDGTSAPVSKPASSNSKHHSLPLPLPVSGKAAMVMHRTVLSAHEEPIYGNHTPSSSGIYTFTWDNKHSTVTSKQLFYRVTRSPTS